MPWPWRKLTAVTGAAAVAAVVFLAAPVAAQTEPASTEPASSEPAGPPPLCRIHELARPAWGEHAGVLAGDPTGRWLGGYASEGKTDSRPVVWHGGAAELLGVPLEFAGVRGINRHGVAVGVGDASQPRRSVAFAYVDDQYVPLGTPRDAVHAAANGVSSDGVVGGFAYDRQTGNSFAVRWLLDSPDEPQRLRVPQRFLESRAVGVTPGGRVAVTATGLDGFVRSYLFSSGGERTRLPGVHAGSSVEVMAVAHGWAAGSEIAAEGSHLFRSELATGDAESVSIPGIEFTLAVNSAGVLGGRDVDGGVLYTDRLIKLPGLPGGFGSDVRTIDDAGRPAGTAGAEDGTGVPVRWRCDLP